MSSVVHVGCERSSARVESMLQSMVEKGKQKSLTQRLSSGIQVTSASETATLIET